MITIAYVSTKHSANAGTQNFQNSLHELNLEASQLGKDEIWAGWKHRMQLYRDFCASLPHDRICLLTDADDVLFINGDTSAMYNTFKQFNKSLVFAGEQGPCGSNCHAIPNYWSLHNDVNTTNRYVNGGTLIGYAKQIVELYGWGLKQDMDDDQYLYGAYIDSHSDSVALDYEGRFFYVVERDILPVLNWNNSKVTSVTSKVNGQTVSPFLLHFPFHFADQEVYGTFGIARHGPTLYNSTVMRLLGDQGLKQWSKPAFHWVAPLIMYCLVGLVIVLLGIVTYMAWVRHRDNQKQCIGIKRGAIVSSSTIS